MSLFFVTTSISQNSTNDPPISGKEASGASFYHVLSLHKYYPRTLKTQLFPSDFNRVRLGESVKLRDLAPELRQTRHQIELNSEYLKHASDILKYTGTLYVLDIDISF